MTIAAWAIDNLSSDASIIRNSLGSLIGSAGGLQAKGALELTQKGTPNMSVIVNGGSPAEGGAWVPGFTNSGPYYCYNNADFELVIATAGATNPRVDTIVLRVKDAAIEGTGHEPLFEALKGAEETGATLGNKKGIAAVPNACLVIGYVLVPAKATSIVTADIENVAATLGLQIAPTQSYGAQKTLTKAEGETGFTPSTTRATFVIVEASTVESITIGGVTVQTGVTAGAPSSYVVPANQAVKVKLGAATFTVSILPL